MSDEIKYKSFSFEEPWLSKTSINMYKSCPYAFYLRYIEGLKSDELPSYVREGIVFHDWADELYNTLDETGFEDRNDLKEKMEVLAYDSELCDNFIEMELERYEYGEDSFLPINTEEFLYDKDLYIRGKYDRLDKYDEDNYIVLDYKTGHFKEYRMSGYRFEMFMYKHLIEANKDIDVDYMGMVFPRDKIVKIEKFKKATENAFYRKVDDVHEGIKNREFSKKGSNCAYCFQKEFCSYYEEQVD